VGSRRRKVDDADAELQDRIDKRSAKIILRAAKRLRGALPLIVVTDLQIRRRILRSMIENERWRFIHMEIDFRRSELIENRF
jgi:hypothetical protein